MKNYNAIISIKFLMQQTTWCSEYLKKKKKNLFSVKSNLEMNDYLHHTLPQRNLFT